MEHLPKPLPVDEFITKYKGRTRTATVDQARELIVITAGGYPYEIDFDRLNTHEKVIDWVHHLVTTKQWVTREVIVDFLDCVLLAGLHPNWVGKA